MFNDPDFTDEKFDLIFSHHVFEHVYNLNDVFSQMADYAKLESTMLHILPCGNEGSYEHYICSLRKDGINKDLENRFFFEDEGHVRRLTTDNFVALAEGKGFSLEKEFYTGQYYGAIAWITFGNPASVVMFTDTRQAINNDAKWVLHKERVVLLLICLLRLPVFIFLRMSYKRNKHFGHYVMMLLSLPFYGISNPIDKYWRGKAIAEWDRCKNERNGSQMFLCLKRRENETV